ncbi:MAG: Ribosomal RNA small subunit methyltransferase B [Gammaproteobacteria bacterium]|nr:Ribosomal RNA small subunit methyltransferase B [Gammaproteobacteria bacterium]
MAYGGVSLDVVLGDCTGQLEKNDLALLKELSFGTLRWFWRCKGVIEQLVARPLKKRDRIIEAVMAVGIYQLEHMRLPPHAAIHATVQTCATLDRTGFKGFVNAVLRNFQRHRDELIQTLPESGRSAHPAWLWQAIRNEWPEHASSIIEANNTRPPMTLRVNTRAVSVTRYLEALRAERIEAVPLEHAPSAVVLSRPINLERLPGFEQGWVSVQDASAQLLTELISPVSVQRVLDACSAPGGKLTHMLEAFPGLEVQAVEVDSERARRIEENLERLRVKANVLVADAANPDQWWDGRPFDLVVLDVPCSATGVIRRHPDIKVLRRLSDIDRFSEVQKRLLNRLWRMVKPGGHMIYVTCSILARENQEQVNKFLQRTRDSREERFQLPLGLARRRGWQILPNPQGGDGFYYAVLRKEY